METASPCGYAPTVGACSREEEEDMVEVHFYSPTVANLLYQDLSSYNWNTIINAIDNKSNTLDAIYADFIKVVK